MIGANNKISNFQVSILLINTIVGVGILSLPNVLAEKLGTAGWILVIISGLITMILVAIITKLMGMYSGKTVFEISMDLIGTPFTYLVIILAVIYFMGEAAFIVRVFAEVIKLFLLFSTPIEVIIISMLLVTSYIARNGIEPLARVSIIIVPFIILPLLVITIVLLPDLDYSNLAPMFRFNTIDLVKSLPTTVFSFGGVGLLLVYMAFSERPKSAFKYNFLSIGFIIAIYVSAFFLSIARFGEIGLKDQLWPLLFLTKTVEFPDAFIENIDGIIMAIWVLIVFTTIMPLLFTPSLLISKMFKVREYRYFVLPILPIVYILSLIPQNIIEVYRYSEIFVYIFGGIATIFLPSLLLILAVIKKRRKVKYEKSI